MRGARLNQDPTPLPREAEAKEQLRGSKCSPRTALLFPGLGQLCEGRTAEGSFLASLGAAELGTGLTLGFKNGFGTAGAEVPLLAFGDLLTATAMDAALELQRSQQLRYVPQESLLELTRAPFARDVMSRPDVLLGIAGTLAAGLLVSRLVDGPIDTTNFGHRPTLFGSQLQTGVGYPIAGAIGVGLFEHVAIAEETAFRGLLQSGWSRSQGETRGWIYGSVAFGLIHSTNIFFMPAEQRLSYLAVGVPFITLLGSYLGLAYQWSGYSLGPPVAIHFWYDFLLEAISFVADPGNSPLALSWGMPF